VHLKRNSKAAQSRSIVLVKSMIRACFKPQLTAPNPSPREGVSEFPTQANWPSQPFHPLNKGDSMLRIAGELRFLRVCPKRTWQHWIAFQPGTWPNAAQTKPQASGPRQLGPGHRSSRCNGLTEASGQPNGWMLKQDCHCISWRYLQLPRNWRAELQARGHARLFFSRRDTEASSKGFPCWE